MCGITGCSLPLLKNSPKQYLKKMNDVLTHRGPDDGGYYIDSCFALAHRRLSIIDLTENGHQPMISRDKNYVIVFNGEIYNFYDLRNDLKDKGYTFFTQTDTEVLLNAYIEYQTDCLAKIRGMFAFAIWDVGRQRLFLSRDRIGKKPLYYYINNKNIAFASEIKSLLEIPDIKTEIDLTAFIDYLKYLYVPHPKSIYKNIFKLEPGHYLLWERGNIKISKYWDIDFSTPLIDNEEDITQNLLSKINESVKIRLTSDVPLGAFLSGGIDSSGIVALMAKNQEKPIVTCTIGFGESKHDESPYARQFSHQFNTDHHEFTVDKEIVSIAKKLAWYFDEPFADSSMIPTYQVSKIARKIVTVALSGDGGDENFAGYEKYVIDQIENNVRNITPQFLGSFFHKIFRNIQGSTARKLSTLFLGTSLPPDLGFYLTNTFFENTLLYRILSEKVKKQINGYDPYLFTKRYYSQANGCDHLSKILYTDLKSYLPGDILVKVDRTSMANSLEVRSPLLDHTVIEYAAKIPSSLKLKGRKKKNILKKSFQTLLPSEIIHRKKHGFDVAIDKWFREDLLKESHNYIFCKEYMNDFFNIKELKKIWDSHQNKKENFGTNLWTIFMFSMWFEKFMEK